MTARRRQPTAAARTTKARTRTNPVAVADEQATILDLRRKGLTVRGIAAQLGMPKSTVQERLDAAIAEIVLPAADEVRLLELERLDAWQYRLEQRLDDDEDPARVVPVALRVQERRAKLLGLDAPEAVVATHVAADADPQTAAVLAQARVAAAARIAALRGVQPREGTP